METIVFEIEFNDRRVFRVFCANKQQKHRVLKSYLTIKGRCQDIRVVTNGIHTTKQWEDIIKNIK